MIVKEEIFIICNDQEIDTPYFSSDSEESIKEGEQVIITNNVLSDCVSWLETNKIMNTTLYLGIWFDGQMNWDGIDSEIMLRMSNIKTHLCISVY